MSKNETLIIPNVDLDALEQQRKDIQSIPTDNFTSDEVMSLESICSMLDYWSDLSERGEILKMGDKVKCRNEKGGKWSTTIYVFLGYLPRGDCAVTTERDWENKAKLSLTSVCFCKIIPTSIEFTLSSEQVQCLKQHNLWEA